VSAGATRPPLAGGNGGHGDAELAGWMRGAAEALNVLSRRGPADRLRAAEHAINLLIRHVEQVEPADWRGAGLPAPDTAAAAAPSPIARRIQISDAAVVHLARAATRLRCSTLPVAQRPQIWARLAGFFAASADPLLRRLQMTVLFNRVDAGDTPQEVVDGLCSLFEWYRDNYGRDAYLTSLARTDLSIAYRLRATGTDLADAAGICREEVEIRIRRYGPDHPFTLVARNLLARCLLAHAEAADNEEERGALARQAYSEADYVRTTRDRLFGATSSNATLSRRYQGHALLLLGDLERARACLRYALAFETERNDNTEWRGSGQTHLLLARVSLAAGDHAAALDHAKTAYRLLSRNAPHGHALRDAAALLRKLDGTLGNGSSTDSTRHEPEREQ
jgi:tetratricopeptide (TPR) repeat protein